MEALLHRFRPEVRFDSFEAHFPVSVDFFVRNSAVDILHIRDENFEILPKGKRLREQIRPAGTCSLEDLVNLEYLGVRADAPVGRITPYTFILRPQESCWGGQRSQLDRIPYYSCGVWIPLLNNPAFPLTADILKSLRNENGELGIYELKYAFVYTYNGSQFVVSGTKLGTHEGDLEHITVRVTGDGSRVIEVFFAAHSNEGRWVPAPELELVSWDDDALEPGSHSSPAAALEAAAGAAATADADAGSGADATVAMRGEFSGCRPPARHVVVYSCRLGHASHHRKGTFVRLGGIANDSCDGLGLVWRPRSVTCLHPGFNPRNPAWTRFTGKWGGTLALCSNWWWGHLGEEARRELKAERYQSCFRLCAAPRTPPRPLLSPAARPRALSGSALPAAVAASTAAAAAVAAGSQGGDDSPPLVPPALRSAVSEVPAHSRRAPAPAMSSVPAPRALAGATAAAAAAQRIVGGAGDGPEGEVEVEGRRSPGATTAPPGGNHNAGSTALLEPVAGVAAEATAATSSSMVAEPVAGVAAEVTVATSSSLVTVAVMHDVLAGMATAAEVVGAEVEEGGSAGAGYDEPPDRDSADDDPDLNHGHHDADALAAGGGGDDGSSGTAALLVVALVRSLPAAAPHPGGAGPAAGGGHQNLFKRLLEKINLN